MAIGIEISAIIIFILRMPGQSSREGSNQCPRLSWPQCCLSSNLPSPLCISLKAESVVSCSWRSPWSSVRTCHTFLWCPCRTQRSGAVADDAGCWDVWDSLRRQFGRCCKSYWPSMAWPQTIIRNIVPFLVSPRLPRWRAPSVGSNRSSGSFWSWSQSPA